MNVRTIMMTALGSVVGLVALVLVIVLPSSDETCETGDVLVGSSVPTLPQLGGDNRAGATSAAAPTSNPAVTGTPVLAAGVGPLRRTLPLEIGTFTVSDVFGSRGGDHKGIDMAATDGTTIYSVSDGRVVAAGPASGFGNWIDTAGHDRGTMLLRWIGAADHPIPMTEVIRIDG